MGTATSINTVFRLIGGTIGPSVAGAIMGTYQASIVEYIPLGGNSIYYPIMLPSDHAFSLIYLVATALAVTMTVVSSFAKDINVRSPSLQKNEIVGGH
jgi:hypothetical protein